MQRAKCMVIVHVESTAVNDASIVNDNNNKMLIRTQMDIHSGLGPSSSLILYFNNNIIIRLLLQFYHRHCFDIYMPNGGDLILFCATSRFGGTKYLKCSIIAEKTLENSNN